MASAEYLKRFLGLMNALSNRLFVIALFLVGAAAAFVALYLEQPVVENAAILAIEVVVIAAIPIILLKLLILVLFYSFDYALTTQPDLSLDLNYAPEKGRAKVNRVLAERQLELFTLESQLSKSERLWLNFLKFTIHTQLPYIIMSREPFLAIKIYAPVAANPDAGRAKVASDPTPQARTFAKLVETNLKYF
ncbi:MAG TPA: hypothetical protein VGQ00_04110 [Candidatus Norongarragalinales archaeon]|jgi:hypothetical protein|nr:hypothetical protein [Candidatus Norongarragalinales archaeon]